jgi:plasmid stabilization system protein ParE
MQIFVTKRAENQLDKIITYIELNWGKGSVNQFIDKIDNIFLLLKSFPTMGQIEFNDIRGF